MEPRYELWNAIAEPKKSNGATPILGYVMFDFELSRIRLLEKEEAYSLVRTYGCSNAEAKTREFEGKTIYYLKPTDSKLNEILMFT